MAICRALGGDASDGEGGAGDAPPRSGPGFSAEQVNFTSLPQPGFALMARCVVLRARHAAQGDEISTALWDVKLQQPCSFGAAQQAAQPCCSHHSGTGCVDPTDCSWLIALPDLIHDRMLCARPTGAAEAVVRAWWSAGNMERHGGAGFTNHRTETASPMWARAFAVQRLEEPREQLQRAARVHEAHRLRRRVRETSSLRPSGQSPVGPIILCT